MLKRILSTILLWTVVSVSLYYGGDLAAAGLLTLLAVLTLHEFYGITARMGLRPFRWMGLGFGLLLTAGTYGLARYTETTELVEMVTDCLLALALLVSCIRVLKERDPTSRVETVTATMMGLLFVPLMLQFLLRLLLLESELDSNLILCVWVVAVAKCCDVGALLTGLAIGRHKMAPEISPKKTWEGAVGGVLFSAGVGAGFAYLGSDYLPSILTPSIAALIAVPLAVIAIISDLMESVLKRRADVKDTGALIPGIGGAFDLTDSLILTAPVAYFIFLFLV